MQRRVHLFLFLLLGWRWWLEETKNKEVHVFEQQGVVTSQLYYARDTALNSR
jgi:hypothetical protein